ncbi:DNA primase [Clostridiales bacterium COT073_COT-073]|nr:DNA primase [Clostridiales bacterium COT073_COT-073]
MYYKEELIEEIRQHNDIVEVIGQYVHLEKKGGSYFGLCPFHNEKTPSFSVSQDKQMYYCFGCGNGGNVFTFMMEYENFNFQEAIAYLAGRVNIQLPEAEISEAEKKRLQYKKSLYEANYLAAKYYYYCLMHEAYGKVARQYLQKRGISADIAKKFALGYATVYKDDLFRFLTDKGFQPKQLLDAGLIVQSKDGKDKYYDRFFNRLMFPIWDNQSRIIAFGGRVFGDALPKYLNSPETEIFEKSKNLYGLHLAKSSRKSYFLLAEGYMDVISLQEAGFDNTVASLGTAFTKNHAHMIKRYAPKVYITFDADDAGVQAALRAIPILKSEGIDTRVVEITGAKDPDELIQKKGKEAFAQAIEQALPAFMFEIKQEARKYNLNDPSDQIRFSEEVVRRLLTLDSKLEINNYRDAIIRQYRLNADGVNDFLAKKGKEQGIAKFINSGENRKKENSQSLRTTAEEELIAVIVSHQRVYERIRRYIGREHFQNEFFRRLYEIIAGIYEAGNVPDPVVMMHHFPEADKQKQIAALFNRRIEPENQSQLEQIITDAVRSMRDMYLKERLKEEKDPNELMRMIEEKKQLLQLQIRLD